MPAFDEETFGPVAAIIRAEDKEEAFELAAQSRYGLGTTLFTTDIERARKSISKIPDGAFFINELVKSDPRLPFGGTKNSGYGRELSREGILEFVNKKTVYVKKNS
jgi:succinate-semialdehyde dehydrogenase/glutarate-semialdehyde dehydrogenase